MATKHFEGIFTSGRIKGYKAGDVMIRDYFIDKAQQTRMTRSPKTVIESAAARAHSVITPTPGKMLMYQYDAKYKDVLPYWDMFPVMFPLEMYKDSFLGLNMHYLPPTFRVRLFDALFETANNTKYDQTTKLNISYQQLKAASNMKYFAPCVKKYLFSHVKSNLIEIPIDEWAYVAFLPMHKFQNATARKVWDDSVRKIMQ
jgi:hypothetical protein